VTSNRNIAIGVGIGIGVISLVAILVKDKNKNGKFLNVFNNFYGGTNFLTGYPKGVRNNNPGNIEKTKGLWKGEIPHQQNTDSRFKQFYNYVYGIRALIINIKSYYKKGFRTIRQIINRWAPPGENNTELYIKYVSGYTGVSENIPIHYNKQTIKRLVEAIIIKENGRLYMSDNDFEKAWRLV
jgi:hypothetical protein